MKFLTGLPFTVLLELFFIYIPLAYHALYGIYIWYRGEGNVAEYPWMGNWLYTSHPLSRCISCCCCMEACPQFNEKTGFVGAATISQVRLFNTHPTGKALANERLTALMGDGGIQECGYAQNCLEVCPKQIPLTTSIADVGRQVMKKAILDFFRS